jgi:hypothetical protein
LNIKTFRVVDSGIVFDDCGNDSSVFFNEFGAPVSDSTESLNNKGLALDSWSETTLVSEALCVEESSGSVVDTKSSGLSSSFDTSLGDELSSAASFGIDILLSLHVFVGILNPGHNLFVGSHIRSKAVNLSSDEVFFDQLHSVFSSSTLNFCLRIFPDVNFDTTFGSTEGDISNCEFKSHQSCESLNFL